jgi:hypothetical protein
MARPKAELAGNLRPALLSCSIYNLFENTNNALVFSRTALFCFLDKWNSQVWVSAMLVSQYVTLDRHWHWD